MHHGQMECEVVLVLDGYLDHAVTALAVWSDFIAILELNGQVPEFCVVDGIGATDVISVVLGPVGVGVLQIGIGADVAAGEAYGAAEQATACSFVPQRVLMRPSGTQAPSLTIRPLLAQLTL